jgi:hypothetical protein
MRSHDTPLFPERVLRNQCVGLRIVKDLLGVGVPADSSAHAPGDVHQMPRNAGAVSNLGIGRELRPTTESLEERRHVFGRENGNHLLMAARFTLTHFLLNLYRAIGDCPCLFG